MLAQPARKPAAWHAGRYRAPGGKPRPWRPPALANGNCFHRRAARWNMPHGCLKGSAVAQANAVQPERSVPAEAGATPSGLTSERAMARLQFARQVLVSAFFLLLTLSIGVALWREVRNEAIEIVRVDVPARLVDDGHAPAVVARRLVDHMQHAAAPAERQRMLRRSTELAGEQPDLAVPIAGLSLKALASLLREALDVRRTQVSGEIVVAGDRLAIRLRVSGHGEVANIGGFGAGDVDGLLAAAAPEVWRALQPQVYAWHVATTLRDQEAVRRQLGALRNRRDLDQATLDTVEYLIGQSLLGDNDVDGAMAIFGRLTQERPRFASGWYGLAAALEQTGRDFDALAPLRRAASLDPDSAFSRGTLGRVLFNLGRSEEALAELRAALRLDPTYALARNFEVLSLVALNRGTEALEVATRYRLERPDLADTHVWYGHGLRAVNRTEDALAAYRRAAEIPNRDYTEPPLPLMWTGRTLLIGGRPEEALETVDRALLLDSSPYIRGVVLGSRALILVALGRGDDALATMDEALRMRPYGAQNWNFRAMVLQRLGRVEEAEIARRRAAEYSPSRPDVVSSSGAPGRN
ncbi:tetratricopeptide repeat protein [Falsiroseomonas sp. HW251]|uniref:tetratricopeptide repeat protein n=1 Tax=Falsiroseomonas sp. HW251 TaxID=3390998 RepID=UPI003D31B4F2